MGDQYSGTMIVDLLDVVFKVLRPYRFPQRPFFKFYVLDNNITLAKRQAGAPADRRSIDRETKATAIVRQAKGPASH